MMSGDKGIAGALPSWTALPDIGLYMDQVITLTGRVFHPSRGTGEITKSMVNNYVKVGLIKRPAGRKYDREQLAQLMMIGVLKRALSMEEIERLLACLCGSGTQEGYSRFCACVSTVEDALRGGMPVSFGQADGERSRAVFAGIAAAVCASYAGRTLADGQ